ncbi:MAG: hypothetical protein KDK04_02220 [Candidatus Competibacteraceae bacterium]|nr:hypothetical protein [Candidatus Competibacteraceae bacterium]
MAAIIIRNLDPATKTGLSARARRHGRSMEAEVRAILDQTIAQDHETLAEFVARIFPATIRTEQGFDPDASDQTPLTVDDFA